jgi:hypothetical protein
MTSKTPTSCWKTETPRVTACSRVPAEKPNLKIPWRIHSKIAELSAHLSALEWGGYLVGKVTETGDYVVTDLLIPEQEVGMASFIVTKPLNHPDIIGTVHSHNTMGAFLSTTDETHIGGNHVVTLVYSTRGAGEYKAQFKCTLECGASMLVDANVTLEIPRTGGTNNFITEADKRITKKVYPVVTYYQNNYQGALQYSCSICKLEIPFEEATWVKGHVMCPECLKAWANSGRPMGWFDDDKDLPPRKAFSSYP